MNCGIQAEGGPQDGEILDRNAGIVWRSVRAEGGWYRLCGKADGSLVYKFVTQAESLAEHLAAVDTRPS